jgi:hypothetical protein
MSISDFVNKNCFKKMSSYNKSEATFSGYLSKCIRSNKRNAPYLDQVRKVFFFRLSLYLASIALSESFKRIKTGRCEFLDR